MVDVVSSDTLRRLLPTGDPSIRMKIEMANLEELTSMVDE